MKKCCLFTLSYGDVYSKIEKYMCSMYKKYAKIQGYDFILLYGSEEYSTEHPFNKLQIFDYFSEYEYLFFMDMDIFINNYNIDIIKYCKQNKYNQTLNLNIKVSNRISTSFFVVHKSILDNIDVDILKGKYLKEYGYGKKYYDEEKYLRDVFFKNNYNINLMNIKFYFTTTDNTYLLANNSKSSDFIHFMGYNGSNIINSIPYICNKLNNKCSILEINKYLLQKVYYYRKIEYNKKW